MGIQNFGAAGWNTSTNSSTSPIFPLTSCISPVLWSWVEERCWCWGSFTRFFGLMLAGEMAVALWRDEKIFQHPLALEQYGLALVLGVGAFALATFGAGPYFPGSRIFR